MPMTPEVRRILWDNHVMTESGLDIAIAARADIDLDRLIGLDSANLDWSEKTVPNTSRLRARHGQPKNAQATRAAEAITAAATKR